MRTYKKRRKNRVAINHPVFAPITVLRITTVHPNKIMKYWFIEIAITK